MEKLNPSDVGNVLNIAAQVGVDLTPEQVDAILAYYAPYPATARILGAVAVAETREGVRTGIYAIDPEDGMLTFYALDSEGEMQRYQPSTVTVTSSAAIITEADRDDLSQAVFASISDRDVNAEHAARKAINDWFARKLGG